jgi:hypothetical protein
MNDDTDRDMNRDPITKSPGSHPVGTGVGAAGGAAAGAAIGGVFGPVGMLVGGTIGAIAGGGAGHAVGERINPTAETEYWREEASSRDYYLEDKRFDRDYHPAYRYGWETRTEYADRDWDDSLEADLKERWTAIRDDSTLKWEDARPAIYDAWNRTDRTYNFYSDVNKFYSNRYEEADYLDDDYDYEDYLPAYRYGAYCRMRYPEREWDDRLETELEDEWNDFKGNSRLAWNKAVDAVRDGWHAVERKLPGDFDNDGR